MSRTFSIKTMFRMTPCDAFKEFFTKVGVEISGLHWNHNKREDVNFMDAFFRKLPLEKRRNIDAILRGIHRLARPEGMDAINDAIEALHHKPLFLGKIHEVNDYARAMMTWVTDEEVFQQALLLLQFQQLSWWRKRRNLPKKTPVFTDNIKHKFERELENLFMDSQCRGYVCTIEMLDMGNGMYYFFAHPDDYPTSILRHDESRELTPQILLKTFEVVFAYDSKRGTLEVCGRVSIQIKKQLEEIFTKAVLESEPFEQEDRVYDLSVFKDINFRGFTDREDKVCFAVQALLLKEPDGLYHMINAGPYGDLYESIQDRADLKRQITDCKCIEEAKLRFVFFEKGDRPYTSVTFEIGIPSKNTVRHLPQEMIDIINKYLERWGMEYHAKPDQTSFDTCRLVEAGSDCL